MFPPEFDYYRARSVADALSLLTEHADADPAVLAGGHGLVPAMKTGRPTPGISTRDAGAHTRGAPGRTAGRLESPPGVLVDVSGVDELQGIQVDADGAVHVGPLVTHATLAADGRVGAHVPVLAAAAREVGDVQVRNRGTIGGNLADADPAADLPAAVVAADATLHVRGPEGDRTIPADAFFAGPHETALADDELLVDVELAAGGHADRDRHGAYVRKTHPATGYAMVGAAVVLDVDGVSARKDGTIAAARIAVNGVQPHAVRLPVVEDALVGVATSDAAGIERAAERASGDLDAGATRGDAHASAAYRRGLVGPYVRRAVRAALAEPAAGSARADGGGRGPHDGGETSRHSGGEGQ